jgi:hypothetical protein
MEFQDGPPIIENVYIGDGLTSEPILDIREWQGIRSLDELADEYARTLYNMSSVLPPLYRMILNEQGFPLQDCRFLFPASSGELLELAFVASAST